MAGLAEAVGEGHRRALGRTMELARQPDAVGGAKALDAVGRVEISGGRLDHTVQYLGLFSALSIRYRMEMTVRRTPGEP
jgi:hypothetical protein